MNLMEIINGLIDFFQANVLITIAFTMVIVFLIFRKPKLFLIILIIITLLAGTLYLVLNISSTGVSHKQKLIRERDLP